MVLRPHKPPNKRETEFIQALNATSSLLQNASTSQDAIFQAFNEQLTQLGLHGSISLCDETKQSLIVQAYAVSENLQKVITLLEKLSGWKLSNYTYSMQRAIIDREVILSGKPLYLPDNSEKIRQIIPDILSPFTIFILKAFAKTPAILAPITQHGDVKGTLYVAGKSLLVTDVPLIAAFANQLAVALENAQLLQATKQAEDQYRRLFETANDGILIIDSSTLAIVAANPKTAYLTGHTQAELLEMKFTDLIPDGQSKVMVLHESLEEQGEFMFEFGLTQKNGRKFTLQLSANLFEVGGKLLLQGAMRDVTKQKLAEEALRQSEERFRILANTAPGVIYLCKNNYNFDLIYVNDSIKKLTGYTQAQFLSGAASFRTLCHPDDSDSLVLQDAHTLREQAGYHLTYRIKHGNGEWRWIEDWGDGVFDEQGDIQFLAGFMADVTERKQAEMLQSALYRIANVANSEISLDDLYLSIHQIVGGLMEAKNFYIALYDEKNGRISFPYFVDESETNPGSYPAKNGLTEYVIKTGKSMLVTQPELEQLIQQNVVESVGPAPCVWLGTPLQSKGDILGIIVVQSYYNSSHLTRRELEFLEFVSHQIASAINRKQAEENLNTAYARLQSIIESTQDIVFALDTEFHYLAFNQNHKNSMKRIYGLDIEIGRNILEYMHINGDDQKAQKDIQRALNGEQYTIEQIYGDERLLRTYFEASYNPIRDHQGQVMGTAVFVRDVSEKRQAEEILRRTQKLESLGIMAGGVAHDFNNLLVAMLGQSSLALAKLPPEHPAYGHIQKTTKAAEKASELTRQLLAYTGHGQLTIAPLDLNNLIIENYHLLEVSIPKNVQFQLNLADFLPSIDADAGQIQQIVMNLILNAAEAIENEQGFVTVSTCLYDLGANEEKTYWQNMNETMPPGNYVMLEVKDTGCGMEESILSRIFDPFFTTKFTGRGLGLAAVMGIVKSHKGGLHVSSEPNKGTTFRLLFPTSRKNLPDLSPQMGAKMDIQPGMILVIDDEEPVRDAVSDILEMEGFQVLTAHNGMTGVAIYQQKQAEISLIILDLSMPGMNGVETFQALQAVDPQVRVLLSSGYSETEIATRFQGQGFVGFIHKPYSMAALAESVRRHMNYGRN